MSSGEFRAIMEEDLGPRPGRNLFACLKLTGIPETMPTRPDQPPTDDPLVVRRSRTSTPA